MSRLKIFAAIAILLLSVSVEAQSKKPQAAKPIEEIRAVLDMSQHDGFFGQASLPICIVCSANDTAAA